MKYSVSVLWRMPTNITDQPYDEYVISHVSRPILSYETESRNNPHLFNPDNSMMKSVLHEISCCETFFCRCAYILREPPVQHILAYKTTTRSYVLA
ncbi:hypothetical protein AVEN_31415-1 [Araneus ventricosus]|uniref:PARP catalytic domain-containing protein n=1 Tax=Araneus ventricosus TaxID=182803 RepID=A0A4Y2EW33_ARAVE|nr:hypothetical protein AVEN_31415-1 [Araneus ventricosus]